MKKRNLIPSIVLTSICLVAALLLAIVNNLTSPRINDNIKKKEMKALQKVLPEGTYFEPIEITDEYPAVIKGGYKSDAGFVFRAEVSGYQPGLILMIGIDNDGKIVGVKHTSTKETYGVENELNNAYIGDTADTLELILTAQPTAPLTSGAYHTAIEAALKAAKIAKGEKTPEQIINDNCNTALGTSGKTFKKWFATEALDGVSTVYIPTDRSGYVFVVEDRFVGVNLSGQITTNDIPDETATIVTAAYTAVTNSTLTDVANCPSGVQSAQSTASGNYVFVVVVKGYSEGLKVRVSISHDGKILASEVLSHNETDSVGGNALTNTGFIGSFDGLSQSGINGVENVTNATVTSEGYKAALKAAFMAFEELTGGND